MKRISQILTVDIGTGTQDIHLFFPHQAIENGLKLVMPSPTMRIRQRIQAVTQRGEDLILTGNMMGGGPCHWATQAHLDAGHNVFATPAAARTFNDDLDWVQQEMGIKIIPAEEANRTSPGTKIELLDFDFPAIHKAFQTFGLKLEPQAVGLAVFDHGAAPPQISDRQFRFDYLTARLEISRSLTAFAHRADQVPDIMTRMQAIAGSAAALDCPTIVMDTAPAAVLGATLDPKVRVSPHYLVANVGNFHTIAFRMGPSGIEGVFEHHTGFLDQAKLEDLLKGLAAGTLDHARVFEDHGHGAILLEREPLDLDANPFGVAVTGPRQALLRGSSLRPYFAVPYGDMMLAGCFGLLAAMAEQIPEVSEPIREALTGRRQSAAPWDIDTP